MEAIGVIYKNVGGIAKVRVDGGFCDCTIRGSLTDEIYVGDRVRINLETKTIDELLERKNLLFRPNVANVDYALIFFSAAKPSPSFLLMDRMLVAAEAESIEPIICINKIDLADIDMSRYEKSGYRMVKLSAETGEGVEELRNLIREKVSVLSGPSGAGKSTITSAITGREVVVGEVSRAANRGRHTTRHTEFFELDCGGLLVDSPGFGAIDLASVGIENLRDCFPELRGYKCRFADCTHVHEPGCTVREAVERGEIPRERYESYTRIMEDL